jgi:type II secretory pathway pseudopilin PulG
MESLIAVAILSMTLVVFLGGLSTGLLATGQADRLSTAHELARSQMEYTKNDIFHAAPFTYATVTPPATYAVTSTASTISGGDASMETLTVSVSKDGIAVFSLEGYKVNR